MLLAQLVTHDEFAKFSVLGNRLIIWRSLVQAQDGPHKGNHSRFPFFCIWAFTRLSPPFYCLHRLCRPQTRGRWVSTRLNLKPKMAHIKETILGFLFLYLGFHQVIFLVEMFTISYHLFCVLFGIILIYPYLCSDFRVGS